MMLLCCKTISMQEEQEVSLSVGLFHHENPPRLRLQNKELPRQCKDEGEQSMASKGIDRWLKDLKYG